MRPRPLRPSYFFWIVVLLAGWAVYQLYGLPHAIWSYSFYGGESGFGSRHHVSCTFIGPYGEFTVPADAGRCGWVAFFHKREAVQ